MPEHVEVDVPETKFFGHRDEGRSERPRVPFGAVNLADNEVAILVSGTDGEPEFLLFDPVLPQFFEDTRRNRDSALFAAFWQLKVQPIARPEASAMTRLRGSSVQVRPVPET